MCNAGRHKRGHVDWVVDLGSVPHLKFSPYTFVTAVATTSEDLTAI